MAVNDTTSNSVWMRSSRHNDGGLLPVVWVPIAICICSMLHRLGLLLWHRGIQAGVLPSLMALLCFG